MPTTLLLENLPLEVLHHVLSNLTASELAPLRSVSIRLRDLATSNAHWRRCLLSDLVPNFVAFNEIAAIPPLLWSFSLVHDGWFRAYCELKRVVKAPWLRRDEDLIGAPWMVYFKSHLPSTELLGIEDPHATIRFTPDNMAEQVSGLPLNSRKWWIEDGVMRVSAYPPNVPGREPRTLCRKFEHSTVAMISDSPEYLEAMVRINNTIIKEAASERLVSQAEAESLRNAFEQAKKSIFPSSDFNMRNKRLRNVLGLTDERGDDREEDTPIRSQESWCVTAAAGRRRISKSVYLVGIFCMIFFWRTEAQLERQDLLLERLALNMH